MHVNPAALPAWYLAELAEAERRELKIRKMAKISKMAARACSPVVPHDLFPPLLK